MGRCCTLQQRRPRAHWAQHSSSLGTLLAATTRTGLLFPSVLARSPNAQTHSTLTQNSLALRARSFVRQVGIANALHSVVSGGESEEEPSDDEEQDDDDDASMTGTGEAGADSSLSDDEMVGAVGI